MLHFCSAWSNYVYFFAYCIYLLSLNPVSTLVERLRMFWTSEPQYLLIDLYCIMVQWPVYCNFTSINTLERGDGSGLEWSIWRSGDGGESRRCQRGYCAHIRPIALYTETIVKHGLSSRLFWDLFSSVRSPRCHNVCLYVRPVQVCHHRSLSGLSYLLHSCTSGA